MIRKKSLICKLIRIKSSSKKLFDSYMASFRPELETCPVCGAKGACYIHAYYGRTIIDFINEKPVRQDITVLRLACGNHDGICTRRQGGAPHQKCGVTHAVLPDLIIPYSSYGLFFILRVLAEYFLKLSPEEKLCERFCITQNQLHKWLSLWKKQKEEWLGVLETRETADRSFLLSLACMSSYSDFASSFVRRFAKSFLQNHKNPADYCQQVFDP